MNFCSERVRHTAPAIVALTVAALTGFLVALGGPGIADGSDVTLPEPEGRVILEISGDIGTANRDGSAVFDRGMLESLGLTTIETTTPWTDGVVIHAGGVSTNGGARSASAG